MYYPSSVVRRQRGRAIRAPDSQFGGPEFKSSPDRLLDCIDVKIIMSENDPDNVSLYEAFYIRKCKPHSIPEKNVLNSQTFYFSILFERPFLSPLEVLCL